MAFTARSICVEVIGPVRVPAGCFGYPFPGLRTVLVLSRIFRGRDRDIGPWFLDPFVR